LFFAYLTLAKKVSWCVGKVPELISQGFSVVVVILSTLEAVHKRTIDNTSKDSVFHGIFATSLETKVPSKALKDRIDQYSPPSYNPYCDLIEKLGGPSKVAEMSGKSCISDELQVNIFFIIIER
jgi:hypothetical protein